MTPEVLRDRPWSKISLLEASHFDAGTAYAAVNTFRLDDLRPHIYRTRDLGRTWTEITAGLPDGAVVNAVREDPQRRGLLFAGTGGGGLRVLRRRRSWQSLRINMPATSIRDLVIKDDDLVVGTHGRSFWILDDITPLRQITPSIAAGGRASCSAPGGLALPVEQEHGHAACRRTSRPGRTRRTARSCTTS